MTTYLKAPFSKGNEKPETFTPEQREYIVAHMVGNYKGVKGVGLVFFKPEAREDFGYVGQLVEKIPKKAKLYKP